MEEKGKLFGSRSVVYKAQLRRRDASRTAQLASRKGVEAQRRDAIRGNPNLWQATCINGQCLANAPLANHPRSQLLPVPSVLKAKAAETGGSGYPGRSG